MATALDSRARGALGLALVVGLGALALWTQAVQVQQWTQDEEYFVQLARLLSENFPTALWDLPVNPFDERGLQRLTILLLAWPLSVVNGETGFEIARALMCLAFASAAIPAYLLLRGVRLGIGWALAGAALTVIVPWSSVTGSFLSESVAYPAALWALWAAWRACVVPGAGSDLLAIAVALAAGFARTNLLVLVAVAPVAVALHTLAGAGRGRGRLRRAAGAMWREHPVFAVLLVPGALLAVLNLAGIQPGPLARLSGSYVTNLGEADFGVVGPKWAGQVSRIVIGVGLVPAILGLPWIVRQLARRTSPEAGALAICGLFGFFVVLFSTMYAAPEERYLMLAAPFLLLPGVVACARGEVPPWGVALGGLAVGVLVARVAWPFAGEPTKLLTDPVEAFWTRVVLSRVPELPGSPRSAAGIAIVALGVVLALVTARRRVWAAVPVALLAAVVVFQVVQTGYVVTKRAQLAGGPGSLADLTWVDRRAGGQVVGIHAQGVANDLGYSPIWREVALWNRRVDTVVVDGFLNLQIPRYGSRRDVAMDERTGRLEGARVPRLMLTTTQYRQTGLVADPVARATYLPVELVRLRGAPRVAYIWSGPQPDGWLTPREPEARVRVLPGAVEGVRDPCLTVTLIAPPGSGGPAHRFTLTAGDTTRRGSVPAGGDREVTVPLTGGADGAVVRTKGASRLADDRRVTLNVAATRIGTCRP